MIIISSATVHQELSGKRIVARQVSRQTRVIPAVGRDYGRYDQYVHRIADGHGADAHVRRQSFAVEIPSDAQRFVTLRDGASDLHRVPGVAGRVAERKR